MAKNIVLRTSPETPNLQITSLSSGKAVIASVSAFEINQRTISGLGGIEVSANATQITIGYTPSFISRINFQAQNFENPNNANWSVSSLAPAVVDSVTTSLTVRTFDDTSEEGIGFYLRVPTDATNITFNFVVRAQTAPASTQNILFRLHRRLINDNATVSTWNITNLNQISIPNNSNYQYRSQTYTLTALSLTAGLLHLIELTRQGTNVSDTLAGDLNLLSLEIVFS